MRDDGGEDTSPCASDPDDRQRAVTAESLGGDEAGERSWWVTCEH